MSFNRDIENLISGFRGLPGDESKSIDRKAKGLESLVEVLLERHSIGKETPEELVMRNWKRIVGEKHMHRCAPEKIDAAGALHIKVSNPTLRRELMFHEDRMMTAIRAIEGCDHITGIVLKAG